MTLLPVSSAGAQPRKQSDQQQVSSGRIQVPRADALLFLIRSTLIALHNANATGNYTVLRDLASPDFQRVNSAARLSEIFARQRKQKLDLLPIAVTTPKLTSAPVVDRRGTLRLSGHFLIGARQLGFKLNYKPIDGIWRVSAVSISVKLRPDPKSGLQVPKARKKAPSKVKQ